MSHERYRGRKFKLQVGGGLSIDVNCVDSRMRFTFVELMVTPVAGGGRTWIPMSTLTQLSDDGLEIDSEISDERPV